MRGAAQNSTMYVQIRFDRTTELLWGETRPITPLDERHGAVSIVVSTCHGPFVGAMFLFFDDDYEEMMRKLDGSLKSNRLIQRAGLVPTFV